MTVVISRSATGCTRAKATAVHRTLAFVKDIYVTGVGSISALGRSSRAAMAAYDSGASGIRVLRLGARALPLARVADDAEALLLQLANSMPRGRVLDRSVRLAMVAAREASARARFVERDSSNATILGEYAAAAH
jgi:3-oxoacyl-(acyl-carrier-protein) synthase